LPVDNPNYQELYSIRNLRESLLAEQFENPEALETRTTAWHRLLATSRAVHGGVHHEDLAVPAYGGTCSTRIATDSSKVDLLASLGMQALELPSGHGPRRARHT